VSQGIDTDSEQAELLLATHGIVDSLYIRELAKKVHRGVEGLALRGLHTGGRCFGYRSVPVEDSGKTDTYGRLLITGVRLEIDESQAATVRRIFADYAAGDSIKTIAKRFNAEGVASPAPYRGQRHPSWAPSAISVMLHNDRYRGTVIWNRTRKVRDPRTGRRVQRLRPQSEWKIQEAPHLQIVIDQVWHDVQNRRTSVKTAFANGEAKGLWTRGYSAPYLLSGFLRSGSVGRKWLWFRAVGNRAEHGTAVRCDIRAEFVQIGCREAGPS
jgi:site-specific DNA recombinase